MPTPFQDSFWDAEERILYNSLFELITEDIADGLVGGVAALPLPVQALVDWDWLNLEAMEMAKKYSYNLIKGITATTRTQVQKAVGDWVLSGSPLKNLSLQLEPLFGLMRATRIAATEVTRIYADANMKSWEASGVVQSRQWMTSQDDMVCPICGELDGEIRTMDSEFGEGFMSPPAHINCRCWIQPVVDEESVGQKLDEVLSQFEWDESLHPRDESGKFTDGGTSAYIKTENVIKAYTRNGYSCVNSYLRTGEYTQLQANYYAMEAVMHLPSQVTSQESASAYLNKLPQPEERPELVDWQDKWNNNSDAVLDEHIAMLDKAIAVSTLDQDSVFYRGIQSKKIEKEFSKLQPGDTFSDKAFLSTSESLEHAHPAGGKENQSMVTLEIHAAAGSSALSVAGNSYNPQEQEWLLPRNSELTVTEITATDRGTLIVVTYGGG